MPDTMGHVEECACARTRYGRPPKALIRDRPPPRVLLRDTSSRATKAFDPALSIGDLIASGVLERHRRFRPAILELEPAWAPDLLHDGLHLRRGPRKVRPFTTDLDWPAKN